MLKLMPLAFLFFLFPTPGFAESPVPIYLTSTLNCNGVSQARIYRCVCRIEVPIVGGGVSSNPLYTGDSSTIFSTSDISGERCEGTFRPDPCRPTLVGRAVGRLTCIEGTTTSAGGFEIR